jgi:dTDP-3-amino-3,4,6-trideoxy-alpha-D-glucose transaminase
VGLADVSAGVNVPFLDLSRIHEPLREQILEDVDELLRSGAFANGPQVIAFEQAYSAWLGRTCTVGVGNGLDALRLGLQALGVGPGDEVVVPAQTFVATWEAVSQVGAVPVPADISPTDYCLDPASAAAAVTGRARALLPVDLYGQLADMPALRRVADRHGLAVVEDACQAHGARRGGAGAGAYADLAAFSFYPGKNLGAAGDAGAAVTDDADLAGRIRVLREHGQREKYRHEEIGWTSRLDTVQAAVLLRKLPHLDAWNEDRRRVAAQLVDGLEGVGDLRLPPVPAGSDPVWHLFVVCTGSPAELIAFLGARGVRTGRHYPEPPHLTGAYRGLGFPAGSFPVAEQLAEQGVSLPIFPGMTEAETQAVVDGVRAFFA